MDQKVASKILKERLGRYAAKYPDIINKSSKFISSHPYPDTAIAIVISKLNELDGYIDWLFMEEFSAYTTNRNTV